jgi:acetyl-CoA C-acetyltransferase
VRQGKEWVEFRQDEFPNRTSSLEKLARLKPAFKENGTVTAGNSSGLNDGCAFLILADEAWCQRHGITPLAEFVAGASAGIDPMYMGLGPVEAIGKLLRKANLRLDEVGSIELNEAFAAQAMGCMMRLEETEKIAMEALLERTNQWGSGIGLGHPLGMTGARITGTLARRMKAERSQYGIASLCIGGGMGAAVLLRGI